MKLKLFRNRIARVYLQQTIYANIIPLFRSNTAVAFSNDDVNMKAILKLLRPIPKIEVIGGIIDNTLMNRQDLIDYSNLPSLEQCREELVQILSQPSNTLSQLLQTNQTNLSLSLSMYAKQMSSESS